MPSYDSILLVAHGSPSGSNDPIEYHASRLRDLTGVPVRCAYRRYSMERVRPAMEELADSGCRDVAVVPVFLSDNMYTRSIPRAMGLKSEDREGIYTHGSARVRYRIVPALGEDPASAEAVADMAASHIGCGTVLVAKHPGTVPEMEIEKRSMELIAAKGIPVAWCNDPSDPRAGKAAMDSLGCGKAVFIPISIGRGVRYELEGAQMLPPFGSGPWIPGIVKRILDRELD